MATLIRRRGKVILSGLASVDVHRHCKCAVAAIFRNYESRTEDAPMPPEIMAAGTPNRLATIPDSTSQLRTALEEDLVDCCHANRDVVGCV